MKTFPSIFPDNLPKATTDPVNVTAPMKTPKNISTAIIDISAEFFDAIFFVKPLNSSKLPLKSCTNDNSN